ncbi:zinc finger FYVE domain-containing protein 9-like [Teleopsis dalmanni]|uniref:zinc finger FYVE domain-containing protein 9-like n=1 Tax=Teleopsis dalmanni TaxID=139649 RepID=UPI0018CDDBA4|nr:zinc finger FYVE domain-containing protein 9-like [Teleopsis dalmanni]
MDLVDIDQVLDNLELREAADEKNAVLEQQTQVQNDCASNADEISIDRVGAGSSSCNKSFVGVSHVFNSLDDYQKNVESLENATLQKYDEECRPITSGVSIEEAPLEQIKSKEQQSKDKTDNNKPNPNTLSNNEVVTISRSVEQIDTQVTEYDIEDEDEDEDEACNDIHRYTENIAGKQLLNGETGADITNSISSDSLTTSSSSTFSSGPSPGSVDSNSPDNDPSALLMQNNDNTENQEQLIEDNSLREDEGNVEDLAVGLSSISITTANSQLLLPCEGTVSSELGNVLEELSETTTSSVLSQLHEDVDKAKNIGVQSYPQAQENLLPEEIVNQSVNVINPINVEGTMNIVDQKVVNISDVQKPITFNSTMDEISDTELDSMLQEMDIDDEEADSVKKKDLDFKTQPTEPIHSEKPDIVADTIQDLGNNAADQPNADSFSQASTVEFSEIKAQATTTAATVVTEDCIQNSISSNSDTSSIDDSEEFAQEQTGARPRPTTLDLPVSHTNLYANAGQTPPGVSRKQTEAPQNTEQENGSDLPNDATTVTQNIEASDNEGLAEATGYSDPHANLGKVPPIWVPDNMASNCMQCHTKFTMIKRRHHCRACGKVLCSVCCSQKFKLDFLTHPESRVCVQCYLILTQRQNIEPTAPSLAADCEDVVNQSNQVLTPSRSPNPNNPMEYCSTIPPSMQVSATSTQPPTVIVPVGVLKKDGSYSSNSSQSSNKKGRKRKSVMFSDGIAPGSDLANMEHQWGEAKQAKRNSQDKSRRTNNKPPTPADSAPTTDITAMSMMAQLFRGGIPPSAAAATASVLERSANMTKKLNEAESKEKKSVAKSKNEFDSFRPKRQLPLNSEDNCLIPKGDNNLLPPIVISKEESNCNIKHQEVDNNYDLIERLQNETLKFAVQKNFFVYVKIVNLKCCMNRIVINFTTCGMHHVGNDEIIILLEFEIPPNKEEMSQPPIPKDIFVHLNEIYNDAEQGNPIAELSYTSPRQTNFLGSREYGGFLYIRTNFQCLQDVIMPENPFLIGILIHRYEVPWAKVFPLRLMLRLGAQYRYYPCPHISMINRESVYGEIAQTIINFLADFRNYSYTLPQIRGLYIHMEDRQTTVLIPKNRQEDVLKAINNSSDHILAFGGNFSKSADGHLVCMQNVNDNSTEMYSYSTQAINIQGQPRKVTGASFFVLNEALKSTSGLTGKCSIVEDGLMVQILSSKMEEVRTALRNHTDIDIVCGPVDADEKNTEVVSIKWVDNDRDFNLNVKSPIDEMSMEGTSSMRVHASFNYSNTNYLIRLTDIYIIKYDEWYNSTSSQLSATSTDITRIAEQIARSTSMALVPFLDLLAASGSTKIGLRTTLHQDNVCYEAGTRGSKLPPLYMNALDNHLIATLHSESSGIEDAIVLELIFYILNV